MKTAFLSLLLMFLGGAPAIAQDRVGNGGSGILCNSEVLLLDFIEAPEMNLQIQTLDKVATIETYLSAWLGNLAKHNPSRARLYAIYLSSFWSDVKWLTENESLNEIPDQGIVKVPKSCSIVQIAGQQDPKFGKKRYYISKALFDKMPVQHQAGLVLHELVWRDIRSQKNWKHSQSGSVRFLTAFFASKEIKEMSYADFLRRMIAASVETVDAPDLSPMTTHDCTMNQTNPHEGSFDRIRLHPWRYPDLYEVFDLSFLCSDNDASRIGTNPEDRNQGDWIHRRIGKQYFDLLVEQIGTPHRYRMRADGSVHSMIWGGTPGLQRPTGQLNFKWLKIKYFFKAAFANISVVKDENKLYLDDLLDVEVEVYNPDDDILKTYPLKVLRCPTVEVDLGKKTINCVQ
jgi:hypothetical protein